MKFLGTVISVLVVLAMTGIGMLFALQNTVPVPLDVLIYSFEPRSLALWVLAAFALGGLAGIILTSFITLRQRAALASTRRQLARTRSELERQRSAGLTAGE
jgi:uncharacterized membrane protein YciS (DUF1049 family)